MLHMRPRPPRRTGLAALCTHTCTRTYTHTPGGSSAGQGRRKTYSANMSLLSSHLCPRRPKVGGGGGEGGKVEVQATPGMQGLASLGQTSPARCFCKAWCACCPCAPQAWVSLPEAFGAQPQGQADMAAWMWTSPGQALEACRTDQNGFPWLAVL